MFYEENKPHNHISLLKAHALALNIIKELVFDKGLNMPLENNKEKLNFDGTWFTRNHTKVQVRDNIATVLESPHEYLKGFNFPIDDLGKCCVSPDMDLVERDRSTDGYSL